MEVVFRAAAVYLLLWGVTRLVGKRELGQLSAFELVLLVSMGDLVQQGVTQEDYSVTGAVLAVGTFALLLTFFSWASFRFPRARPSLEGRPVLVIRDGRLLEGPMRMERLTDTEVLQALRQQGVADVSEVRIGLLEPDGSFSFLTGQDHQPPDKPVA